MDAINADTNEGAQAHAEPEDATKDEESHQHSQASSTSSASRPRAASADAVVAVDDDADDADDDIEEPDPANWVDCETFRVQAHVALAIRRRRRGERDDDEAVVASHRECTDEVMEMILHVAARGAEHAGREVVVYEDVVFAMSIIRLFGWPSRYTQHE